MKTGCQKLVEEMKMSFDSMPTELPKFVHKVPGLAKSVAPNLLLHPNTDVVLGLLASTFQGNVQVFPYIKRKNKDHGFAFVGGKPESGETVAEALSREVMEEIGCSCSIRQYFLMDDKFDGRNIYVGFGIVTKHVKLFGLDEKSLWTDFNTMKNDVTNNSFFGDINKNIFKLYDFLYQQ